MAGATVDNHGRGVIVATKRGRVLAAAGMGLDPRLKALVSDDAWMRESVSKRIVPMRLDDAHLTLSLQEFDDAYLLLISQGATDTVMRFLADVDAAYDVIDTMLTDAQNPLVVIDADEKVCFMSPVHEKFFGVSDGQAVGHHVREVIPNTRLHQVVRSGEPEVGQIQEVNGHERVVSRYPLRRGGKIVGAIARVTFLMPRQVEALAKRIKVLERQIETYKVTSARSGEEECMAAIVGQSPAIQAVRQQIRKIAPIDIPVLIEGESGTGKELVAQALHLMSQRQSGRLITVNAAALPDSLVESELFGYEAGSFTGADRKGRPGKFELADRGTMFLDEIGDMPLEVQTKLLRVLQDRMVERVGGERPKQVDFRLVSATNRDLEQFVDQGRFRLDLFYRISPIRITLPALKDRTEDIPLLLAHFAAELAKQYNRPVPEIDTDLNDFLMERTWPGNVRQLRHEIERAFVFSENGYLRMADFTQGADNGRRTPVVAKPVMSGTSIRVDGTLKTQLDSLENQVIQDTLARFGGNKKKVAEHLGISRSYLYKKLEEIDATLGAPHEALA